MKVVDELEVLAKVPVPRGAFHVPGPDDVAEIATENPAQAKYGPPAFAVAAGNTVIVTSSVSTHPLASVTVNI